MEYKSELDAVVVSIRTNGFFKKYDNKERLVVPTLNCMMKIFYKKNHFSCEYFFFPVRCVYVRAKLTMCRLCIYI